MSGARAPAPSSPSPVVPLPSTSSRSSSTATARNTEQSTNITVSPEQERAIINYARRGQEILYSSVQIRSSMEEIDKQYQREKNYTSEQLQARVANRLGDATKLQDVTVPIVMPQTEACLSYLTNVFLTGYPIFGVSSNPSNEDVALMLDTIMGENSVTAGWVPEILRFFRDGLKYNLHCLEVTWDTKTTWAIDTDLTKPNNAAPKKVLWNGNSIKRIDLYNAFWDYRCFPQEIAEYGEFAGYTDIYSRSRMLQSIDELQGVPESTRLRALKSQPVQQTPSTSGIFPFSYYQPLINPFPMMSPANSMMNMNWMSWAMDERVSSIDYQDAYNRTVMYARIIPDDFNFKVPGSGTPQVWKFIIVNGQVVLYAERLSSIHNKIPMFFGQPLSDGLRYQTKSFAQNVVPMQEVASALWSGFIASKRRLVTDRVLFDPSRIRASDINSPNPSAKIPVRPSAYGKPLAEAVYQFPYRDEQANSFVIAAREAVNFANMINNQNPAQQGQFVKGNKTLHEYEDTMAHGNGSNQMMALNVEGQIFTPIKEVLKLNILQFQRDGEIFNSEKKQAVKIDQLALRKTAVQFKVSDGLLPQDKQMSTDEFQVALQVVGSTPAIAGGFNLPPLFSYIMKLRGADLTPFQKSPLQMQYEQQLGAWQQAAAMAAQSGSPFSTPQPTPSPELQQEMQTIQQSGGTDPAAQQRRVAALLSTQGS